MTDCTRRLAVLVRTHRRKIPRALFEELKGWSAQFAVKLCVLLRLAVLLNRSRSGEALPEAILGVEDRELSFEIYDGWLEQHPLTRADLDQEAEYLTALGLRLSVASR